MIEPDDKHSVSNATPATDVGSILKQARLRRGQSFEVVHQHTRIPKKFLEALENNRFDEFPAIVYLRGFLKSYCEHLDIDFEPLWKQIQPSHPKAEPSVQPAPAPVSVPAPVPAPPPAPASDDAQEAPPNAKFPVGTITAIFVVVAFGLFWGLHKNSQPTPAPPPLSHRSPEALPPVVRPPEKMTLKIIFLNEAWLSLRCDDHLRFEGRGPAGFTQAWSAMKEFALRTSNPGDLRFELDNKEYQLGSAVKSPSGEYVINHP